jgi:hypothetical protein
VLVHGRDAARIGAVVGRIISAGGQAVAINRQAYPMTARLAHDRFFRHRPFDHPAAREGKNPTLQGLFYQNLIYYSKSH